MSIKQRLIKRSAATAVKPMRRQAASERAELYKHEADMMIAEVEKAIGSGKVFGVPVYNLYFTDDEQEAINEFLYEEYPSVAAFVDNEIELAASNGDDEWINAAQELGEKYANDAEGFCKAYMDFWEEHGYYGLIDMYITDGQLFEDWKKRVYEEAQSAAERHDTRAASRKRTLIKRSAAKKRFAAASKVELAKQAFKILEQQIEPGMIFMVPNEHLVYFDRDTAEELAKRWCGSSNFNCMTAKEYLNDFVDVDAYMAGQDYDMSPSMSVDEIDEMMDVYKKYKDNPEKFCEVMNDVVEDRWYNGPEYTLATDGKLLDEWEQAVLWHAKQEDEAKAASRTRTMRRATIKRRV